MNGRAENKAAGQRLQLRGNTQKRNTLYWLPVRTQKLDGQWPGMRGAASLVLGRGVFLMQKRQFSEV